MKTVEKNMYSLILTDDVVRAVDQRAHQEGTSRSNLINRILAEYLSVMTPERYISELFEAMTRTLCAESKSDLHPLPASGSILTVRGVLPYKYNPAIRFRVEVSPVTGGGFSGVFRTTSRSRNEALLSKLTLFFEMWSQIETACLSETYPEVRLQQNYEGGTFHRSMQVVGGSPDPGLIGQTIGRYMLLLQNSMQRYFKAEFEVDMQTFSAILEGYRSFLKESPVAV